MANDEKKRSWASKFGRSMVNSAKITYKGIMPNTAETINSAREVTREIRTMATKYSNVARQQKGQVKNTPLAKTAKATFDKAMQDLRNGTFSRDTTEDLFDSYENDIEPSFDIDFNLDDEVADKSPEEIILGGTEGVARSVVASSAAQIESMDALSKRLMGNTIKASQANAESISGTILYSANLLNTTLLTTNSKLDAINDNLVSLVEFQGSTMTDAIQQLGNYMEETVSMMNEMGKMFSSMQDLEYGKSQTDRRSFKMWGGIDFKEYARYVKEGFKNSLLGSQLSMYNSLGGKDDLKKMLQDPVGTVMQQLFGFITPKSTKDAMSNLDKNLPKYFDRILKRIGRYYPKNSDLRRVWPWLGIGNIFGNPGTDKNSINMGGYHKDALPWNGFAQRAITEVIPEYLSSMDNSLNTIAEIIQSNEKFNSRSIQKTDDKKRYYDYDEGKFKTRERLVRDFRDDHQYSLGSFGDNINELLKNITEEDMQEMVREGLDKYLSEAILGSSGDYSKSMKGISGLFKDAKKTNRTTYSRAMLEFEDYIESARKSINDSYQKYGTSSTHVYRNILNDTDRSKDEYKKFMDSVLYDKNYLRTTTGLWLNTESTDEFFIDVLKYFRVEDPNMIHWLAGDNTFITELNNQKFKAMRMDAATKEEIFDSCRLIVQNAITRYGKETGDDLFGSILGKISPELKKRRSDRIKQGKKGGPVTRGINWVDNTLHDLSADFEDGERKEGFFKKRSTRRTQADMIREQVQDEELDGSTESILNLDSNELNRTELLQAEAAKKLSRLVPQNQEEADNLRDNVLIVALSGITTSFKTFTGGLFGKDGIFNKFWDSDFSKNIREKIKTFFFDENTGVFGDKVKDGKQKLRNLWEKTKDELMNGYDFVYRNTMTYLYGEDYKDNENYQKYLAWADFKTKRDKRLGRLDEQSPEDNTEERKTSGLSSSNIDTEPVEKKTSTPHVPKEASDLLALPAPKEEPKKSSVHALTVYDPETAVDDAKEEYALTIHKGSLQLASAMDKAADQIGDPDTIEKEAKKTPKSFWEKAKKFAPKVAAAAIAGGLLGTAVQFGSPGILGAAFLPGGPIAGAIAASGLMILSQTEAMRSIMFGKKDEATGERFGGLFNQKMKDSFKKALPFVVGGATLGVIKAAILPNLATGTTFGAVTSAILPTGILGGALLGAGLGILKNSETIKTMLFGEKNDKGERTGKFLSRSYEKFKGGITRFFPAIGNGLKGLGVGALTGLTLSQMGFLPAMFSLGGPVGMGVAGLGLGILSTSKKFNEFVFGADILDENGEPTGKKTTGLLTRVTNMLKVNVVDKFAQSFEDNAIKLVDWTKDKITLPFRKAFGPILDSILGIKNNVEDFIKEKFDKITSGIMETFDKTMKAIFRPFTTLLGKVINFGMGAITTSAKITMAPTAGILKLLEIGTMGKRRKEYVNYYKDYFKSLPGFLKGKWDTDAEAGERRGIFGKGFDILNSVFNRDSDIALAARAGYNETMTAVGKDHLGWREAPQEQRQLKKDMKAHKKERDMWKKADKLRGNIIRDDLGYREMELTDSQVEKYRRRFSKLGLDESKLQTSEDIMNLLYRKGDWKRGKSVSEVILEDGVKVQESPEQKAYRERTEKYQDKMERYMESIKDAMADKGLRYALNLDEMQSETEKNRYISKVVRRMQKKGIDINKYDFRDMGTIDLDLFDDELFDAYRDSEYMESGDFATFAKLKQKERDDARKKKEHEEAKKRKETLDDRQRMNSSDFMQRVFKDGKLNPDVEFADLETNGMGLAKTSMLNKILQNGAKQGESLDQTLSTKIGSDYEQKLRDSIMKFASTANGELNDTMKELVELIRKGNEIAIEGNEISQTIADTGSAEFEINTEGEMSGEDIAKKRGTRKRGKIFGKFGKRKIEKYHISEGEDKEGIIAGVKSFFRTQEDEEKDEKIRSGASSAKTSTALMIRDEDREEDTEDTEKSLFSMVLGKIASTTSKLMGTPVARFGVSLLKKWALASGVLTVAELISPGFQDKIIQQSSALEQALENHDLYYDYVQPAVDAFFGKIGDLIRNFSDNFDHYWDDYIYPAATHIIEGVANKVPYIVDILSLILTNLAGPFTEAFMKVLPTVVKDVFRGIWNATIGDIKPEWYWNSDGSVGYSKEGEWKSGGKTEEEKAKTKEELEARKARNPEYNYKTRINPKTGELEYTDEEGNDIAAIDPTTGAVTKVGDLDKQHIVATAIRNGIFSAAKGENLGSFIFKNTGRAVGATVGGAATLGSAVMPLIPTVAVTGAGTRIGGKAGQAVADIASAGKIFRDAAGQYVDKEEAITADLLRERILGNLTDEEIVKIMKDGKLSFDELGNVTEVRRNATLNELVKKNKWNKNLNPEGIKGVNRYVSQDVQTRIMNELFSNASDATLFGPPTLGMSEEVAKKAKYAKIGSSAINELMGDEGFSNLAERMRDYRLGNIADAAEIDNVNSELTSMIKTKLALKAAQEGEDFAEKELADLAKVTTNALIGNVDKSDSVGAIIARKTAGASKSALDAAAESSAKAIAKANNSIVGGFINKLKGLPAKLKSHKKLMKVIDKVSGKNLPSSKILEYITKAIEKVVTKLAKVAAEHPTEVGGRLAKLLLKAGKGVTRALPIIGLLFTIYDIANGAFNAANLFHVSKEDVNAPMRIVSAIINALLSWGPFILIDITFELIEAFTEVDMKSKFAEWLYDFIAPKAMEDALDEAQAQFEAERVAYNEEHEDANLSATAYNDMKNKGMLATAKDTVTGWFNKITRKTITKMETSTSVQSSDNHSNTTSIVTNTSDGYGFGEWSKKSSSRPMGYGDGALSQKDSKWSNIPLGTLPNGKPSTMADGGCGPTSLAMVASQLTGTNVDPGKIGVYASRNGYISQGGANAGLFSEGATNLGLNAHQLTNTGQIVDSLKAGKPTIISGKGNHNSDPYTSDGHIVVANGLDASGNVIIRDPLDGKTKTYPVGNVINNATGSWSYGYGDPMGYGFMDWLKGSPSNAAAEEAPTTTYAATSAATKNKTSSTKSSNRSTVNGQKISNPRHYSNAWAGTVALSDATLRILLDNYKNASTTTEEVYTTLKSYANQQMIISPNSWDGITKNGAGYAVHNPDLAERCVNNYIYKYRNNSSYVKSCRESLDRASATGDFGSESTLTSDNTVDDGTSLLQNLGIQIEGTKEGVMDYITGNTPDSLAGKFSMLGTVFSNYVSALVGGEDPWEAIAKALSDAANSEESEDGSTYTSDNATGTIKNQNLTIPENLRISLVDFGSKYPSLKERIKQIGPFAQQVGVAASLPPSYVVAQGIKESTLGPNGMARRTNNMFGITANKSQIRAGRYVAGSNGNFLKSDSVGGGMVDYGIFMQGDYYSGIRAAKSADEAADEFAKSPYLGGTQAQKNKYASELKGFYKQYNLYELDKVKGWGAPMGYGSMAEAFKSLSESFKDKLYDKVGFSNIYDRAAAIENLANAMNGSGKKSSSSSTTTVVGASYKGTSNNAKTYMKQALGNVRISSDYGMRKHPISGKYKKHNGIDYAAPGGTNIYSPVNGTVVRSSNGYNGGYGNLVVVKDGQGYQHYFAHQSKRSVEKGTKVSKGGLVGHVGTTGASTGNHLHYGIMAPGGYYINPANYNIGFGNPNLKTTKVKNLSAMHMDHKVNIGSGESYYGSIPSAGGQVVVQNNNGGIEARLDALMNVVSSWYSEAKKGATSANTQNINIINSGNTNNINRNNTTKNTNVPRSINNKEIKNKKLESMHKVLAAL